ncbi:MAG TPA: Hsp20/alpha crystallin family protein [Saprospiraceae bacterium]|nr:Hsp20/alpha crystallin family protein [Saprospiraceae bacterium]
MRTNNIQPFFPARSINQVFDNLFNRPLSEMIGSDLVVSSPTVNIKDKEDAFVIELAAPGLDKNNFDVKVEDNFLKISYEHSSNEEETKDDVYTRREFRYTSFSRSFQLPEVVDADQIKGSYQDGILTVNLPKNKAIIENKVKTIEIG